MKSSRFLLRPTRSLGFLSQTFHATHPTDTKGYILKVGTPLVERKRWARELRVFDRELAAYQLLAPLAGKVSPRLHYGASAEAGADGLLLLEEIGPARKIDQVRGLEWTDLRVAALAIARVHAHFWNSPHLKKIPALPHHHYMRAHQSKQSLPLFLRWAKLGRSDQNLFTALSQRLPKLLARIKKRPFSLLHGDLRSDNIFFQGNTARFIDWGLAAVGCPAFDLARLAGGSARQFLSLKQHEELVRSWHSELLRRKVSHYPVEEAWSDYRDAALLTLTIPITNAPILAKLSSRGQRLAKVITRRFIFAARELAIG